jgi:hypothetical protein
MLLTKPKMATAAGMTAVICFAIPLLARDERSERTELKAGQKAAEQAATVSAPQPTAQPSPTAPAAASAQASGRVRVGPNVHVSKALSDHAHWEVILAEGLGREGDLFAASMAFSPKDLEKAKPNSESGAVVAYASRDGGKTWAPVLDSNREFMPGPGQSFLRRFFQDPALACGPNGEVYFACNELSSYKSKVDAGEGRSIEVAQQKQWLRIVRSSDGGRTWQQAVNIGDFGQGFCERPFLTVDRTNGKYKGRIYCTTDDGLFVSNDGRSFRKVRSFARKPLGNPVVLADGTLAFAVGSIPMPRSWERRVREKHGLIGIRTSSDGGDSFSEEQFVATNRAADTPWLNISTPVMAAYPGQPGRLYVVWQDRLPSGRAGIRFAASADKGATFSKPVWLSEQPQEGAGYDAFVPSVAVNAAGAVAAAWYDTRALERGQAGWDVRLRASTDGGKTWAASVRVTEQTTLRGKKTLARADGVGHTAGLMADADGGFRCLWVDGRTGVAQVWTAAVHIDAANSRP